MGEPDRGHRIAVANRHHPDGTLEPNGELLPAYEPKTEEGKQWQGFGTGLKPAMETICLARKPLSERNVALNVLKWNCGALNIDGCRIETSESLNGGGYSAGEPTGSFGLHHQSPEAFKQPSGRFPANLIHDGSQEVLELFNKAKIHCAGYAKEGSKSFKGDTSIFGIGHSSDGVNRFGDSGSAARFFYCAKASRSERDAGLDGVEAVQRDTGRKEGNPGGDNPRNRGLQLRHNDHATIKPLKLMRYLVTLITPPGGIVCDPFAGSGSTLIAAKQLGFGYVGIELDPHNVEIIQKRLAATELFS
jgi:site-specific DNA-methyltransferase (adenine-specific)